MGKRALNIRPPGRPAARPPASLTATDFYKYLTCPHWPWFERYANAEEKKLKRELTPAEERRLDDGFLHERDVMRELTAGKEVKQLSETGDPSVLFQATLAAMQSGASTIYQGTLVDGDWHGRPDLLVREEGASKLGNWHYVPLDIKASHELKPAHRLQLAFYCFLLQRIQGVFPKKAGIINRDKEEHWIDPSGVVEDFESVLAELERIRAGEKPPLVLRKACQDTSPWGKACQLQAESANDIALLYNVDVRKLAALRDFGIRTVADAAELSIESLAGAAPGLTAHGLEMIRLQARSLQNKTVFIKEPVSFPESAFEIYFDIESDAPNDMDYLYGFLIRDSREGGKDASVYYEKFVADKPEDEGEMWRAFLEWLPTLPVDYVVYHYAPYEPARLRILETRYGGSEWLEKFRSRFIDLKPIAGKNITFPLYFYGLKYICKSLGFSWTGELQSGGASIDWYERWCEVGDRNILNQIIQYNEDDVRATLFLKDWLQKYAGELAAYDKPYPWEGK
jgi:predicted RecB family nuclease